uniref:uncharacterized protein LOC124064426 n=1 Tax=Scatophagus argus TaxID=75038 RepID=UPI001ED850CC|nr:uncharacterized protein LOC124064426 [Scatophagus argus]
MSSQELSGGSTEAAALLNNVLASAETIRTPSNATTTGQQSHVASGCDTGESRLTTLSPFSGRTGLPQPAAGPVRTSVPRYQAEQSFGTWTSGTSRRRACAQQHDHFNKDVILLPNPSWAIVCKQGTKVWLHKHGHILSAFEFQKVWDHQTVIQHIRDGFGERIPEDVSLQFLMACGNKLVSPKLQKGQELNGILIHKVYKTKALYVKPSRMLLSGVCSLKPRSQSQHVAQPTVLQPHGAVRKKFVTMAPVDWSARSVQSAVCSLKTRPKPQSQPQSQPLPQPTALQSHYGVVKKEFVTMAPVDWSAHSVQSAVVSLKPRPQSEHLPQPTVLQSDDEEVRKKPVTTAPVLHSQSVKDNESSTSHSLPVLRHVATQTDPTERRSVGTQQTNVRSIATQATVSSRDCGVCTLTFPLDSPLLFLQPAVNRAAKRTRLSLTDKDECLSECSVSLVVHEPEDST